jgi:hypothetical protein
MGDPTSSYATAGIALRVSGTLKPHLHDKVETQSMRFPEFHPGKISVKTNAPTNPVTHPLSPLL